MGIDVYMRWKGQTEEEKQAQYTGFSVQHGHVGYLREAYHGGPYATRTLVGDCWDEEKALPATVLTERLPATLEAVAERARKVYKEDEDTIKQRQQAFIDFVALAQRKEQETGQPVTVMVSA